MAEPDIREHENTSEDEELYLDGDGRDFSKLTIPRRSAIGIGLFVVVAVLFLYWILPHLILPQISGLKESFTQARQQNAAPGWLLLALIFEVISYAGYVWLLQGVFKHFVPRIGWRESYEVSLAGVAATRLFAAAGAGGIALTYWTVRRAGMRRRNAAGTIFAFFAILYGVFMLTVLLDGTLLLTGALPGRHPFALTAIPMILAGIGVAIALAATLLPTQLERAATRWAAGRGRIARFARRLITAPAIMASGTRSALRLTREREIGLLGGLIWWSADIAVLWSSFHAFGYSPAVGPLVMGYFVGLVANTIPIPGGIGAVETGMIGAFAAFGFPTASAITAVLTYRVFAFWIPTIPGALAYLHLRKTVERWREQDGDTIQNEVTIEAVGSGT